LEDVACHFQHVCKLTVMLPSVQVLADSAVALAVAQEALRLRPAVGGVFRAALRDTAVSDISVPKGTFLYLNFRDSIRGTGSGDPKFDPAYWLAEDGRSCAVNNSPSDLTFSAGPRSCVGRNLALIETLTAMVVLAREVKSIEMSEQEAQRDFFPVLPHPTGMPATLVPR
jgi:cytochrome P450